MLNRTVSILTLLIVWMVLIWASGCAGTSPPPDYYILSPISEDASRLDSVTGTNDLRIGIGPMVFPGHLDRPHLLTRQGDNRVKLSEFDRWVDSLEDNFIRVLMENLMILLDTDHVYLGPWTKAMGVEYRIAARIMRFDSRSGGDATLKVRWSVIRELDREVLMVRTSTYTAKPTASGATSVVAALNQTLSAFSRDVAEGIIKVSKQEHGY
jgi:uncharacterized lipoprotein YmbA